MTINLDPPPGFRGLHPSRPVRVYVRNLPHWRQDGATYFVTFCLADALPAAKKNQLLSMRREWECQNPEPRDEAIWTVYAKTVFREVEKWIDEGHGACWFKNPAYGSELRRTILHFHELRYDLGCFVIMANHCHVVIRPLPSFELEDEVGSMKSVSARFIHNHEKTAGTLWQQESYDRIIRDEEHLYRIVQYIGVNPRRAGVGPDHWNRWINPRWQACGWDFCDA